MYTSGTRTFESAQAVAEQSARRRWDGCYLITHPGLRGMPLILMGWHPVSFQNTGGPGSRASVVIYVTRKARDGLQYHASLRSSLV
jgi:hypothetical protein